jgi:4-amino-4-deoxy-L-arabinose transferase-like glycosyltransferase
LRASDRRLPLAAICLFVVAVGLWNAARYPTGDGYDAAAHMMYADGLVWGLHFPQHVGEYYTPPGFYFVAGVADWVLKQTGYGAPDRAGQVVNVCFLLGTVLLVAAIARALWPGRRKIELGAAAFVAFLPVAVEAAAMFHPEPMSMFLTTLALWLSVRTFASPRYAWALGVTLGVAQLVRAFALWTVAAVAIALVVGRRPRALVIVIVLAALIPAPWYIHQRIKYGGQPEFPQPSSREVLPATFWFDPAIPALITRPTREHHYDLWIPTSYDGIWGDYFGVWAWHSGTPGPNHTTIVLSPSGSARHRLELQSILGLLPTLLALVGWALFARASFRERAGLAVALLPPLAIVGYLYFAFEYWTSDGDLLKATYMLTAAGAWAIGFGYALDRLRGNWFRFTVVVLSVIALAELPFLIY